jgi:hypothetical protein
MMSSARALFLSHPHGLGWSHPHALRFYHYFNVVPCSQGTLSRIPDASFLFGGEAERHRLWNGCGRLWVVGLDYFGDGGMPPIQSGIELLDQPHLSATTFHEGHEWVILLCKGFLASERRGMAVQM